MTQNWEFLEFVKCDDGKTLTSDLACGVSGITVQWCPMVEDLYNQLKYEMKNNETYSLGEGLSTGSLSEIGVETERLGDGEVGWLLAQFRRREAKRKPKKRLTLHGVHWSTWSLLGRDDLTSSDVEDGLGVSMNRKS